MVLEDAPDREAATPPADQSQVRVVHASPASSPVDVELGDETTLEDVAFGDATDYLTVDPGEYEVVVLR